MIAFKKLVHYIRKTSIGNADGSNFSVINLLNSGVMLEYSTIIINRVIKFLHFRVRNNNSIIVYIHLDETMHGKYWVEEIIAYSCIYRCNTVYNFKDTTEYEVNIGLKNALNAQSKYIQL